MNEFLEQADLENLSTYLIFLENFISTLVVLYEGSAAVMNSE